MLADRQTIQRYLPQRPPMLMVHNLVEVSASHAISQFRIEDDNIFTDDGFLQAPGLIENIAQTAAAQAGYHYLNNNLPVPIGFIAAIRNLVVKGLPEINSSIDTTITITNQVLEMTIAQGTVEQNGHILCLCEMRIFTKK